MADAVVHQSQHRNVRQQTPRQLKRGLAPGDTEDMTGTGHEHGADGGDGTGTDHDVSTAAKDTTDAGGSADGIALRRLLAVATLSPAQAGLLALDLVDAVAELAERGQCPEQVNDRSVLVLRDGTLTVAAAPDAVSDRDSAPGSPPDTGSDPDIMTGRNGAGRGTDALPASVTTANSLVRLLVGTTRGGGERRRAEAALLTDRLAGSSGGIAELRQKVRGAVTELVAAGDDGWDDWAATVRRQITALVTATEGRTALRNRAAPPKPDDTEAVTAVEASARTLTLARGDLRGARRRAWNRKRRLPGKKAVLLGIVVVLVVVAGWWAVPRAWSELRRGWEAVFTTSQPSQQLPPVSPPVRRDDGGTTTGKSAGAAAQADDETPRPVPRLAPEQAGPINGVRIERAEGDCERNEICPVRVDVMLDPSASPREISWSLRVVDRCTGKIGERPGVTMTAESWWRQVYGISRPTLSGSPALAIVAVTDTPAKAASAPLFVTADRATC